MPTVNRQNTTKQSSSNPSSKEAILLEQIGTTEAVKTVNEFTIATDDVDPDPVPLPDIV